MHNGRFRLLEIIVLMCVASFRVMIFFLYVGISQELSVVLSQSTMPNVRQPLSDSGKGDITFHFTYNVFDAFNLFCFIKLHIEFVVSVFQDLLC